MHPGVIGGILLLVFTLCTGTATGAQAEWETHQTLSFDNEPLDMLVVHGSRRVYVLNNQGEILVYAFNGRIKGKIDVGPDVVQIEAGPNDDMLFLLRRKIKSVQSITISLAEKIDIDDAPFKGPANAPVTIAVFSDFQ